MIWYQPHTHLWVEVGVNAGWLMRSSGWDECCLLVGKWSASSTWLGLATINTTTTVIIMVGYCVLHFLFLWRTDFVISSTYQSSMELFMATRGQRRQFLFVRTFKLHLSSPSWPFIWLLNRITRKYRHCSIFHHHHRHQIGQEMRDEAAKEGSKESRWWP